jgi:SAM-dependent methyltransferase
MKDLRSRIRFALHPLELMPHAPVSFGAYRYLATHPDIDRRAGGWVYRDRFYPDYLTEGAASGAIFREALKFCQGRGVDVGAGFWPLPGAIPLDLERGPGAGRSVAEFPDGSLDYVFSSHCLEHIGDWREALDEWASKVRPDGTLFLYLPHPDCAIWHPGSPFVRDGHKWSPTPEVIKQALGTVGFRVIASDDGPDVMQSFYVCGLRIAAATVSHHPVDPPAASVRAPGETPYFRQGDAVLPPVQIKRGARAPRRIRFPSASADER